MQTAFTRSSVTPIVGHLVGSLARPWRLSQLFFTPTALYLGAQGRERSERTLGTANAEKLPRKGLDQRVDATPSA